MEVDWKSLSQMAWSVRDNASILGKTKVGSALVTSDNIYFGGCNVEHVFRNHDVHAEVNAITNMIASGESSFKAILVAAERENFTPCGSCLDWIFQFGGESCLIGVESSREGELRIFKAIEMMPYYPF